MVAVDCTPLADALKLLLLFCDDLEWFVVFEKHQDPFLIRRRLRMASTSPFLLFLCSRLVGQKVSKKKLPGSSKRELLSRLEKLKRVFFFDSLFVRVALRILTKCTKLKKKKRKV